MCRRGGLNGFQASPHCIEDGWWVGFETPLLAQQSDEEHREVATRSNEPLMGRTRSGERLPVEGEYSAQHLVYPADVRLAFACFGKLNPIFGGSVFMKYRTLRIAREGSCVTGQCAEREQGVNSHYYPRIPIEVARTLKCHNLKPLEFGCEESPTCLIEST